jgi:RimJ/RimL family protein N-acetyltransferase
VDDGGNGDVIETVYHSPTASPVQNKIVGDFVSAIVFGAPDCLDKYCTMAVHEDGKLIAGTVYHNYHPQEGVVELTSASTSKRWLTRPVINAMFCMPFASLRCQLVVLRVSERNTGMCKIARKFGFDEVYIPRLRGRDEGEYIFTLTDDAWNKHKVNTNG